MTPTLDTYFRPLRSLRISLTDKCNLRCRYCMPEEYYTWLDREEILSFDEITDLVGIFTDLGVERIRLTGGEPLLRRELDQLVRRLVKNSRIRDLALTTNGLFLQGHARALREAGLPRLTVSLDTLRPERFRALTGRDSHSQVLEGILAAREAGFNRMKINAVIMRGFNEDEISDLIEFAREIGAEARFIEYMDVGGATHWSLEQVVPKGWMLASLERRYGPILALGENGSAPAERFVLPDGTTFGIIASVTQPFCGTCGRGRLTPDGMWFLCLYAREGIDLKRMLRRGARQEEIAAAIVASWRGRSDRGAEERKGLGFRGVFVPVEDLRRDPHLEMHTRGG